jgi:beta-glucosidase
MKEEKSLLSRYGPQYVHAVSLYEGIAGALPNANLLYAQGCAHIDQHFPESDIENFPPSEEENELLDEAVATASQADVIIVAVGDNEKTIGESHSRLNLKLPGLQELLIEKIAALNKPTVVVLVGGRPATINFAKRNIPAIIASWYLGETTGNAVADVLFGMTNPSGKLSVPFPKFVGQIPLSFPLKPAADAGGNAGVSGFLFPFGFGLSYTTFEYSDLKVKTDNNAKNGTVIVSFNIKNTGKVAGDEIAQLYIHQELNSVITYNRQLRGFARISLQPNETKNVEIKLSQHDFSILNGEMERVVEPGWFDILIGAGSEDIRLQDRIHYK